MRTEEGKYLIGQSTYLYIIPMTKKLLTLAVQEECIPRHELFFNFACKLALNNIAVTIFEFTEQKSLKITAYTLQMNRKNTLCFLTKSLTFSFKGQGLQYKPNEASHEYVTSVSLDRKEILAQISF